MLPLASHLQAVAISVHQIVKDMVSENSSNPAHLKVQEGRYYTDRVYAHCIELPPI